MAVNHAKRHPIEACGTQRTVCQEYINLVATRAGRDAAKVIGMLVGHQNGVEIARRETDPR
jgi:hypothetical protein